MYERSKQIMEDMLDTFRKDGISDAEIHNFYLYYQKDHWHRHRPESSPEEIDRLAQESTLERLAEPQRKRIFEMIKHQINGNHNDFMCEFLALYLQQRLASEGIESQVGCLVDHYVLLKDGNWLFPGEEWGAHTGEELRYDHSLLARIKKSK
jgi:hypothetical protein